MHVQVKDRLARPGPVVNHGAVSFLPVSFRLCNLCCRPMQVTQQRFVFFDQVLQSGDVLARYYQRMEGSLRVYIAKSYTAFVLKDYFRRDFPRQNTTEEAACGAHINLPPWRPAAEEAR